METSYGGRQALERLAKRFPQLYVAPCEGAQEAHRLAAGRGIAPDNANLDHFAMDPEDELRQVDTPSGPIWVLFLKQRCDFETFLQIIGHKSSPAAIAPTVGAITYLGLADWGKVAAARTSYLASGGSDWGAEFARLAATPGAFRSRIVVISEGPYSNIDAGRTPYGREEWLRVSRKIRLYHECAHVVCRSEMPDHILEVWDEVTADVVGLICATGAYSARLATLFLGVSEDGYTGGRITEYLNDDQMGRIDEVAREIAGACARIQASCTPQDCASPFDYLLRLKRAPLLQY